MSLDMERPGRSPFRQHFNTRFASANEAGFNQNLRSHVLNALKSIQVAEIYDDPLLLENIGKAALWNAPLERHLPPFKPRSFSSAGPSLQSFVPPGCGLAVAGANSASDPFSARPSTVCRL